MYVGQLIRRPIVFFRQVFETGVMLVSFDHAVLMVGCNGGALDVQMDFGGRKEK